MTALTMTGLLIITGSCDPAEADDILWWLSAAAAAVIAWGTLMAWLATRTARPRPPSSDRRDDRDE